MYKKEGLPFPKKNGDALDHRSGGSLAGKL